MNNLGRAVWNSSIQYSDMRKPHGRGGGGGQANQHTQGQFTLSPNAKEFVPRSKPQTKPQMPQKLPQQNHVGGSYANYNSSHQTSSSHRGGSLNDRLISHQHHNNSPHQHHQQYPRSNASSNSHHNFSVQNRLKNQNQHQQSHSPNSANTANFQSSQGNQMTDEEGYALNYITEAVKFLNEDPGLFDSLESHLSKAFAKFGDSEFILSNAMEIIFVQSIEEQNFRYMGAKLYRLLDLINPHPNSVFRRLLNYKLTYHQEEVLNYMNHEQAKVRATTLFLAELYMQLKSDTFKTNEIANNIVFTINQLLLKPSPENIKCICLTLKLCGYDLDVDCPEDVRKIIENLNQKVNNIDVGTSRVLETVLLLQKNNWGRSESISQSSTVDESPASYSDLPVFYGPDGEVMTEEENSFLESQIPQDAEADNDCDDCDLIDPDPEMDPEIESAYEDFLKQKPKDMSNKSC